MNRSARRRQTKLASKTARESHSRPPAATGQAAGGVSSTDLAELIQKWVQSRIAGRKQEAESIYRQVLTQHGGKTVEAMDLIARAIAITPDQPQYHYYLGNAFQILQRLDDAVASYHKAIAIKPDFIGAHNNLGTVLQQLRRQEEAVASFQNVLAIEPDSAVAHCNIGTSLQNLGALEDAVASYHRALAIEPDLAEAWENLKITMKALQFPEAPGVRPDEFCKEGLSHAARATSSFALLEHYLDGARSHEADESFRKAMAALPPKAAEVVSRNGTNHSSLDSPQLPDKMVALLHFGRSGTGLFHSLIDGHPEISTLPSIYLQGFFNIGVWSRIAADGWRGLPERFAEQFAVLFDAASPDPTPGLLGSDNSYLGFKEGTTAVGKDRNISLSLDRDRFCSEANRLMNGFEKVDPGLFLQIVHAAFEKTVETETAKHTVFYHIHSPDDFAKLNFLRYVPDARLVMMVREPIQSCESWLRTPFKENDYHSIGLRIISMLFALDQIVFRTQDSVGVRLEDLKKRPEATMRSLCAWLGINETPSLYESTVQGEKWWGDPSSPEYKENEAMSPFGEAPISRAVGAIFSETDQFVLRTLFYPISVRFGYREPDPAGFVRDLKEIRPLFDDLLDFERALSEKLETDPAQFRRSGTYRLLRASFVDRWDVLNDLGDYPGILTPLDID